MGSVIVFVRDSCVDSKLKHLIHTRRLFSTALDIYGAHTVRDSLALLWSYGCETLGLEEVDACSLCAEVRFEANKDKRCGGTEMEDFRVPLDRQASCQYLKNYEGL